MVRWHPWELALAVFLAALAFIAARYLPRVTASDTPGRWFLESTIRNTLFLAVPLLLLALKHGRPIVETLVPRERAVTDFGWGLELALILCSLNLLASYRAIPALEAMEAARISGAAMSNPPLPTHFLGAYQIHNMRELVLFVFGWGIFPAFGEEVLFRGMIFAALRRHMRAPWAILLSAMAFALYHYPFGVGLNRLQTAHLDPILSTLILGLVVATVYEYSGSLLAPIMAHIGLNASFVVFLAMRAELARLIPPVLPAAALAVFSLHFFFSSRYLFRARH
jgi:membrane protease YdiL (CAAX protease family)